MDWIHLALDKDQWRDLVNMAIRIRLPSTDKNLLTVTLRHAVISFQLSDS